MQTETFKLKVKGWVASSLLLACSVDIILLCIHYVVIYHMTFRAQF